MMLSKIFQPSWKYMYGSNAMILNIISAVKMAMKTCRQEDNSSFLNEQQQHNNNNNYYYLFTKLETPTD